MTWTYFPATLPPMGQDAKELLKTLQSRNERMFQITFLVLNTADTRRSWRTKSFGPLAWRREYNNSLVRLDYQQEQGLMSKPWPLGASHIRSSVPLPLPPWPCSYRL